MCWYLIHFDQDNIFSGTNILRSDAIFKDSKKQHFPIRFKTFLSSIRKLKFISNKNGFAAEGNVVRDLSILVRKRSHIAYECNQKLQWNSIKLS